MTYDWFTDVGAPLNIVWDASGLLSALSNGLGLGALVRGGVPAAMDGYCFQNVGPMFHHPECPPGRGWVARMGPIPLATTTFNTSNVGMPTLGTSPSGTLPLVDDGVGGSPQPAGLFAGVNFNFDFTELTVTAIPAAVPVPAAVWLFGSG